MTRYPQYQDSDVSNYGKVSSVKFEESVCLLQRARQALKHHRQSCCRACDIHKAKFAPRLQQFLHVRQRFFVFLCSQRVRRDDYVESSTLEALASELFLDRESLESETGVRGA